MPMHSVYERALSRIAVTPQAGWELIKTIDMHTAGEPLRVILSGIPRLSSTSVLEFRELFRRKHDRIRKLLMLEPRGHADMYGCILLPPNDAGADFGVVFLHNEGYSTMCGHAVIALSVLAAHQKWIDISEGDNPWVIDVPCGRIHAYVSMRRGEVVGAGFRCVPSFVTAMEETITVPKWGQITFDIAYGGAFYAYVDLQKNNLPFDLTPQSYSQIIQAGMAIKSAVIQQCETLIHHPTEPSLSFLYGTIFVDKPLNKKADSRNVCVFAQGEVDRSPTGSGVSGRAAIHYFRGEMAQGESMLVESITDQTFQVSIEEEVVYSGLSAVVPKVEGMAYITGQHTFFSDPKDPFSEEGFSFR